MNIQQLLSTYYFLNIMQETDDNRKPELKILVRTWVGLVEDKADIAGKTHISYWSVIWQ